MLQCLSKALTRASSLWLFRTLISTWLLLFMLCSRSDRGPVANSFSTLGSPVSILSMSDAMARGARGFGSPDDAGAATARTAEDRNARATTAVRGDGVRRRRGA